MLIYKDKLALRVTIGLDSYPVLVLLRNISIYCFA